MSRVNTYSGGRTRESTARGFTLPVDLSLADLRHYECLSSDIMMDLRQWAASWRRILTGAPQGLSVRRTSGLPCLSTLRLYCDAVYDDLPLTLLGAPPVSIVTPFVCPFYRVFGSDAVYSVVLLVSQDSGAAVLFTVFFLVSDICIYMVLLSGDSTSPLFLANLCE